MGICHSCTSVSVSTAKLILPDGKLQEFSYPVKTSYILLSYPDTFICNSDDMEFDGVLTAVKEEDELKPGELYFALPLSRLTRPLLAEEMAALAVKANAALLMSKSAGKDKNSFYDGDKERSCSSKVADFGVANNGGRNVRRSGRNCRRKMSVANLSVIPE